VSLTIAPASNNCSGRPESEYNFSSNNLSTATFKTPAFLVRPIPQDKKKGYKGVGGREARKTLSQTPMKGPCHQPLQPNTVRGQISSTNNRLYDQRESASEKPQKKKGQQTWDSKAVSWECRQSSYGPGNTLSVKYKKNGRSARTKKSRQPKEQVP